MTTSTLVPWTDRLLTELEAMADMAHAATPGWHRRDSMDVPLLHVDGDATDHDRRLATHARAMLERLTRAVWAVIATQDNTPDLGVDQKILHQLTGLLHAATLGPWRYVPDEGDFDKNPLLNPNGFRILSPMGELVLTGVAGESGGEIGYTPGDGGGGPTPLHGDADLDLLTLAPTAIPHLADALADVVRQHQPDLATLEILQENIQEMRDIGDHADADALWGDFGTWAHPNYGDNGAEARCSICDTPWWPCAPLAHIHRHITAE